MELLSNHHNDHPNQHENCHKLSDETGHPVSSLMETKWKLKQKYDHHQNLKAIAEEIQASEERNKSKRAGL